MNTKTEETTENSMKKGPGDLLQAARIELGITVEEIARQMNLNASILKSIEEDEYKEMQSPIFIRGYLRTYARLVSLDENEIIGMFGAFYQIDEPSLAAIGNTAPEISSSDFRVKWMTYIVIAGTIALIAVWWINNYQNKSALVTAVSDPVTTTEVVSVDSTENIEEKAISEMADESKMMDEPEDMSPIEIEPLANEPTTEDLSDEEATQSLEAENQTSLGIIEEDTAQENTATEEIAETEQDSIIEIQDSAQEGLIQTEDLSESTNVKSFSGVSGNDELVLTIIATSWGEIKDAEDKRIVQDLFNSGDVIKIVGQKPFKVFLGNGYGVEMKLNNESFEFSEQIKSNNTARFEVGL